MVKCSSHYRGRWETQSEAALGQLRGAGLLKRSFHHVIGHRDPAMPPHALLQNKCLFRCRG